MKTAVIAVGGNAILRPGDALTPENQMKHVKTTSRGLADLIQRGYDIVITHGNGPQVGNMLLRAEIARNEVPLNALDVCVAESQGQIGYMLQQALSSEFVERGMNKIAVSIITQVVVSETDPAFTNPSKPIGRFYPEEEAKVLESEKGWKMILDRRKRGWRRVVPSPEPVEIVESAPVGRLVFGGEDQAEVVIACGGGGIPVIRKGGRYIGVEAVVDKDLAAALLANRIRERLFVIATDVENVCIDFGKPTQRPLANTTLSEIKAFYDEDQFPSGTMGPKILAAIRFLEGGGEEVVITATEKLVDALEHGAGTHIYRDDNSR
ncbi:MAG: carbamate kinase [Methanobacteriota archaeon]|nr:MAG: carbamate kinase [Euryarchaeota archaeon]